MARMRVSRRGQANSTRDLGNDIEAIVEMANCEPRRGTSSIGGKINAVLPAVYRSTNFARTAELEY
jgi:hypothetical protein